MNILSLSFVAKLHLKLTGKNWLKTNQVKEEFCFKMHSAWTDA